MATCDCGVRHRGFSCEAYQALRAAENTADDLRAGLGQLYAEVVIPDGPSEHELPATLRGAVAGRERALLAELGHCAVTLGAHDRAVAERLAHDGDTALVVARWLRAAFNEAAAVAAGMAGAERVSTGRWDQGPAGQPAADPGGKDGHDASASAEPHLPAGPSAEQGSVGGTDGAFGSGAKERAGQPPTDPDETLGDIRTVLSAVASPATADAMVALADNAEGLVELTEAEAGAVLSVLQDVAALAGVTECPPWSRVPALVAAARTARASRAPAPPAEVEWTGADEGDWRRRMDSYGIDTTGRTFGGAR